MKCLSLIGSIRSQDPRTRMCFIVANIKGLLRRDPTEVIQTDPWETIIPLEVPSIRPIWRAHSSTTVILMSTTGLCLKIERNLLMIYQERGGDVCDQWSWNLSNDRIHQPILHFTRNHQSFLVKLSIALRRNIWMEIITVLALLGWVSLLFTLIDQLQFFAVKWFAVVEKKPWNHIRLGASNYTSNSCQHIDWQRLSHYQHHGWKKKHAIQSKACELVGHFSYEQWKKLCWTVCLSWYDWLITTIIRISCHFTLLVNGPFHGK